MGSAVGQIGGCRVKCRREAVAAERSSCLTVTVRSCPFPSIGLGAPVQAMGGIGNLLVKVIAMSWFGAEP